MPHPTFAEHLFYLSQSALQFVIVFLIFRRKLYSSFPAFTAYLIVVSLITIAQDSELALGVSLPTYMNSFYCFEWCSIGLEFWVIYEVFKTVLEPYEALRRSWRFIFLISVFTLVVVNLLWIAYEPKIRAWEMLNVLDWVRSVRALQIGLLVVVFALSRLMGLSWRSYCLGMALGLGIYVATEIVTLEVRRHDNRWAVWELLNVIRSVSYAVAIVIWAWYFFQPTEVAKPVYTVPNNNIEKWNRALQLMLARRIG